MKKRALSILLAALFTLCAFAACGGEKPAETGSASIGTAANQDDDDPGSIADADTHDDSLQIGVAGDYFPFCYTEKDELQGFEIDMWNEIASRLNREVTFTVADFTGLFGMLDTEKIDSIGHGVAVNPDREAKYLFSDPYLYADFNVVTAGDSTLQTMDDFAGKRIAVVMGGEGERKLQAYCDENDFAVEIVGYESTATMDEDVLLGRVDARLGPKIQTLANIEKNGLSMKVTDIAIFTETDAYPFAQGDTALQGQVNDVLADMREDGTLATLSKKWFSVDATVAAN